MRRRLALFGVTIMFYKATDACREVHQFQVQNFIRVPYALSLRGSLVCTMCYPCAMQILKSESFRRKNVSKTPFYKGWKIQILIRLFVVSVRMGQDFHQTLYRQILRVKTVYWFHSVVSAATIPRHLSDKKDSKTI